MLPLKKRPYRRNDYHFTKRLRNVEMLARTNRPEIKSITFVTSRLLSDNAVLNVPVTNILEGTGGNERLGDKVRLIRVEVRGTMDSKIDAHLLKCYSATLPSSANFTSGQGSFLLDSERDSRFQELTHYRSNYTVDQFTKFHIKRNLGFSAWFNGAAASTCQRNQVSVTLMNRSGAARNYDFSVRLWYSDA